jgi:HrpA-like RNA helicase
MSNPGTTEWTCVCKDCLAEFQYSDTNYLANKARGYSRPERCPDCRKQHSKEVGTVGQPYFKVKPLFPGVRHDKLTSVLGRLNHPERPHIAVHTTPQPEPEDKFGIKDDKIIEMFRWFYQAPELQVVVVVGPTGSGKSTYFPYRLVHPPRDYVTLDPTADGPERDFIREPNGERKRFPATDVEPDLFHRYGQIVVTQPRIQATRNIPGYIAKAMLGSSLGAGFDIGYQYAKNPASDWRSKLRFCTDGSLINWIATGQLDKINTVMIDEAHERSLNIDIIIGLLTQALPRYPRLKLIIASATISADLFINHFNKHLPRQKEEQWIEISNDTKIRRKLADGPDLKPHPDKPGWWLKRADNCELIEFDGKSFQVDPHFNDRPLADYAFLDPNQPDKEAAEKVQDRLKKLAETAPKQVADKAVDLLKDMYTPWDDLKTDKGLRKTVATDPTGKKCEIVVDITERRGDILGFLHGEKPIQECCTSVRSMVRGLPCRVEALPLYTSLPQSEQDKALLERKPGHHEKLAQRVAAAVVDRHQDAVVAIHDNVGQFDTIEPLIRELIGNKRTDLKDDPSKLVIQRWAREEAEPASGLPPALKDAPAGGVLVVVASSRGLARSGVPKPVGDQITLLGQSFTLINQEDEVRRVVVSTNVAETSLTIHGILHVVDSGLINQNKWDSETQTTGVRAILQSRAGCKQRWGRAGRLQAGDAWPLYTLDQFGLDEQVDTPPGAPGDARCFPYYSQPEIRRSPLEQVLLTAKKAGLETLDVDTFPWLEAPDADELKRAEQSLVAKGALDEKTGDLTSHGLEISGFQEEAKLANLLVIADRMACAVEMATVLAILKVQYSKLFLRNKEWDDETKKQVEELHDSLDEPCRDDLERALKIYAGWSSARAAGQALADLWACREAWPTFSGRVRTKVGQIAPDQVARFDDFARMVASLATEEDVDALRRQFRTKIGPWREWYDECRVEAERGRRARAAWEETQDTWRVVTKCPGWVAAWSAAVEPIRIDAIAKEVLAGLGGSVFSSWVDGLQKVLDAVEARSPAEAPDAGLTFAEDAGLSTDTDDDFIDDGTPSDRVGDAEAEQKRAVAEAELAAAEARQAATTKFLAAVEDKLVEFFVARLLRATGPGPHRVTAEQWLADHGVPAVMAGSGAAEFQTAVEANPEAGARTLRPAAIKLVRLFVSQLSVPAQGARETIADVQITKLEKIQRDEINVLWEKLDELAAGFVKDLGYRFRTPAENSVGQKFTDAAAEATGLDDFEALVVLAGDHKDSWIPRLRASIAKAAGRAWAAANYIDERALGDKDKVEALRNELIDSLSGHKKEEERRPINFALLDRIRLIFAHALPEHCYELAGNTYSALAGADDPAGQLPGQIDKASICASRPPGLIVCGSRRAQPTGRDGKRSLWLSFVISLDGAENRPGPALSREIITGTGGTGIPLADWTPFAMAAHLADSSPISHTHSAAESARLLFDQKFPLQSVWTCALTHAYEGVAQGWWVEIKELIELRKPIKERMGVRPVADFEADGEGGGDFVQSTFAGETPDPVFDPDSTEDDPATTPQGHAVWAADREREIQLLFDEDEAASSLEGELPPGIEQAVVMQPDSIPQAEASTPVQRLAAPAQRVVRGRLIGSSRDEADRKGGTTEGVVVGYELVGDEWVVVLARERREVALARLTANETLTVTVLGPATGSKSGVRVWVPKAEAEVTMAPCDFGFCDDPAVTDEVLRVWSEREQQKQQFMFVVTVWELDAPNGILRLTTFPQIEAHLQERGDLLGKQKARLSPSRPDLKDRVTFLFASSRPELGLVFTAQATAQQVAGLTPGEEVEVVVSRRCGGRRGPSVWQRCDLPPGSESFGLRLNKKGNTQCTLKRPLTFADRRQLQALCNREEDCRPDGEVSLQSAERFLGVLDELYEQSNRLYAETAPAAEAAAQLSGEGRDLLARVIEVNDHGARLEFADPRSTSAERGLSLWLANDHCGGRAKKFLSVGDQRIVRALAIGLSEGQLPVTLWTRPPTGTLVIGEIKNVGGNSLAVALQSGFVGRCPGGALFPGFDSPPPGNLADGSQLPFVVLKPMSDRPGDDVGVAHREAALFALKCRHPEVVGADFRGTFVSIDESKSEHRRVVLEFGSKLRAVCYVTHLGIGSPGYLNYALDQLLERLKAGETAAHHFDVRLLEIQDKYLVLSAAETLRDRISARLIGQTIVGRVVRVDGPFVEVELAPFLVGSVHYKEFGTAAIQPHDLFDVAPINSPMPVVVLGFNEKGFLKLSRKQAFRRALESTRGQAISGRIQRFVSGGVIVELATAITGYCRRASYSGLEGLGMLCEVVFQAWDETAPGTPVQLGGCRLPTGKALTLVPTATTDPSRLGTSARTDLAALVDGSVNQLASAVAAIREPLARRDLTKARTAIEDFRHAFPLEHPGIQFYEQRWVLLTELHDQFLAHGLAAENDGHLEEASDVYEEARRCWPLSDRVPPRSPSPVRTLVKENQVLLSWTKPAAGNVVKHHVMRSVGEEPPVLISELEGCEFIDKQPPAGVTLHFSVVAVANSSKVTAHAPPVLIPAEVSDLRVSEGDGQVTVTWTPPAAARSVEVWRQANTPPGRYQGTLLPHVTFHGFDDAALPKGTTFGYHIVVVYEDVVSAGLSFTAMTCASSLETKPVSPRDVNVSLRRAALFALRCRHPEVVGAVFRGKFISLDERDPDRRKVVIEFGPGLRAGCEVSRLGIGSTQYLNQALDQLVERVKAGQVTSPIFDFRVVSVPDDYLAISLSETWRNRIKAELIGQTVFGRVVRVDWPSVEIELTPFLAGKVDVSEFGTVSLQPHTLSEVAPINSYMPVVVLGFANDGNLQLSRRQAFRQALEETSGKAISGRIQRFVGTGVIVELAPAITGYCQHPEPGSPQSEGMSCDVVFDSWDETVTPMPIQLGICRPPTGMARTLVPTATADATRPVPPARGDLANLLNDSFEQLATAVGAIRTSLEAGDTTTASARIKAFRVAFPLDHPGIRVYEQWMATINELRNRGVGSTRIAVPNGLGTLDDRLWQ